MCREWRFFVLLGSICESIVGKLDSGLIGNRATEKKLSFPSMWFMGNG